MAFKKGISGNPAGSKSTKGDSLAELLTTDDEFLSEQVTMSVYLCTSIAPCAHETATISLRAEQNSVIGSK